MQVTGLLNLDVELMSNNEAMDRSPTPPCYLTFKTDTDSNILIQNDLE